ncbi:MAG: MmgE/PrpD family protein [Geodermatophilaceae bacterium]|nr:MmgE/PrpD family protein [Geodermatophilaceae bacterium]
MSYDDVAGFIHGLTVADLPPEVVEAAERSLLDLLGVAAGGSTTRLSQIVREHSVRWCAAGPGGAARLLFDGRPVSPVGAALAGAATIDSLDAHDGHALAKGHAGVAVLPAVLACAELIPAPTNSDLLIALVVGYEVAIRAGIALHASTPDYHCSGAWNALGAAAVAARMLGLSGGQTEHALGIAEYHGPRGQMMRCIEHPTMVKDGSDRGAAAGVSAALLAADGFTGAPALTAQAAPGWTDLGHRWRILDLYYKPYPVCRWAHPAIDAALELRPTGNSDISAVEVVTFYEAAQLTCRRPVTTEQAQYSLPFPVAVALLRGNLSAADITGDALADETITRLADSISVRESAAYSAAFPAVRSARVTVTLTDGRVRSVAVTANRGDPAIPLTGRELIGKFRQLAQPVLGAVRSDRIEAAVAALSGGGSAQPLMDAVLAAP